MGKPEGKIQKMVSNEEHDEQITSNCYTRVTNCEIGQTRNLDFERRSTSWTISNDGRVELYNNRSELFADNCPRN